MMKPTFIRNFRRAILFAGVWLALLAFLPLQAGAEDVSAQASLSDDTVEVNQQVDLTLEIKGEQNAEFPRNIEANGLGIQYESGPNVSVSMQLGGASSRSVSCVYAVTAGHAGKFTIPAITISSGGKNFTTKPLTLTVTAATGGGANGNAGNNSGSTQSQYAFGEIIVPKQTAYVGEAIPVEIRFYFDPRARFQLNMPEVTSEGFTMQPLGRHEQEQIDKDGKRYDMLRFKTAITPVKSGKLTFGPAVMHCVVQVPQRARPPQGMDGFFNDDIFNQMMGLSSPKEITVTSDSADFEVKPLPAAGQPKNFDGAVGQFTMSTEAAPLKLNVGDPITLTLKITGHGNFDRVNAPALADAEGWRSYPASGKFTADDDLGISGTKSFEMPVIPNEKKTTLPDVEFSYFDPVKEKYVTLKDERMAIAVEGSNPAPAPAVTLGTPAGPSATPEATKRASDIQYLMTGAPQWGAAFTPIFKEPVFWEAQGAPALALAVFALVQARRKKARDLLAKQLAEWRREQNGLMAVLRKSDTPPAEFYDAAGRFIQIAAARVSGRAPESIGPGEAIAALPEDEETRAAVQAIFDAQGELRYAGVTSGRGGVSDARRQEVLQTLRKFQDASE